MASRRGILCLSNALDRSGELRCCNVRNESLVRHRDLIQSNAGRLFPYEDFYKWLAYGNGRCRGHCHNESPRHRHCTIRSNPGPPSPNGPAESKHPQADASYMQRREFCFTLDGDIFVRYQSFKVGVNKGKGIEGVV